MPKEIIVGAGPWVFEDGTVTPVHSVQVGWSEQSVQIATIVPDQDLPSWRDSKGLGNGWYIDLDRKGINDLIRVLRRARDRAFGADE